MRGRTYRAIRHDDARLVWYLFNRRNKECIGWVQGLLHGKYGISYSGDKEFVSSVLALMMAPEGCWDKDFRDLLHSVLMYMDVLRLSAPPDFIIPHYRLNRRESIRVRWELLEVAYDKAKKEIQEEEDKSIFSAFKEAA